MKVRELISYLKEVNDESEVLVSVDSDNTYDITRIIVTEEIIVEANSSNLQVELHSCLK